MSKTITDVKVKTFRAHAEDQIQARAIIGNAQKGGWSMLLDDAQKAAGTTSAWVPLGKAGDLFGSWLEVSAVIMDIRPETDRLSLVVEVSDGATTMGVPIAHTGDQGDRAAYSVLVAFVEKGA